MTHVLKYELYKNRKGEFAWRLKARNGKKVASSGEGNKNKRQAKRLYDTIQKLILDGRLDGIQFVDKTVKSK